MHFGVVGSGLIGRLLQPLASLAFYWLLIKPYVVVRRARQHLQHVLPNLNLPGIMRHHHVTLYLVLGAAILVIVNSLHIRKVEAEDFGQHSLLLPLLEEEFGFLDEPIDAAGEPILEPGVQDELRLPTDVPFTLTESGAAILKPYLITTRPGVAGRVRIETYVVQSGDTLSDIANRFQINIVTLLWENRLTERSVLRIGQNINILPTNGVTYRVGRGDTVAKIAQRYGVKADAIASFNQVSGGLTVGSTIVIPGGRPPAPPPQPKPRVATAVPPAPSSAVRTNTKLQWPAVGRRITQYYTWRHGGIDIGDTRGTPVYAAESGVVEVAGWNRGGYGYYIIVDHGGGLKTLYAHNTKLRVTVGDRVERGQQIADMGSTGRSTGPHLHFEVRVNGRRQNPLNYTR